MITCTLPKWAEHYRIYALKYQFHFALAYAHVTNVMTLDSALHLFRNTTRCPQQGAPYQPKTSNTSFPQRSLYL